MRLRGIVGTPRAATYSAALVALFWVLTCVRWFDAGEPFRPGWLALVPPWILGGATLLFAIGAGAKWRTNQTSTPARIGDLRLAAFGVGLALAARFPLAWQGAAGYVTADGALSGLVALHVRDGVAHDVFVPNVPYSGSLKSHLTAPLACVMDPARAFALVSLLFYGAFVAATLRLGERLGLTRAARSVLALTLAFTPAFVTRYSLSNDGNYVEVLALGTWALVLLCDWIRTPRSRIAFAGGLLLGAAFWCHILALVYGVTFVVALWLWGSARRVLASAAVTAGSVLGYFPGLLWNVTHSWDSFRYLLPGHSPAAGESLPLGRKVIALATDALPVLFGYDVGYPPVIDRTLRVLAFVAIAAFVVALARAVRAWTTSGPALGVIVLFVAVNTVIVIAALPVIPGNPRYLLFWMTAVPILFARSFSSGRSRWPLGVWIALCAATSFAQGLGTIQSDQKWRAFAREIDQSRIAHCYSDFYLATKVTFLTQERTICCSKLGPTFTEYFFDYRRRVEAAPSAALIAVNETAADKVARRLDRLGVTYQRREAMKPIFWPLSRKVDPEELFPGHPFPLR